MAAAALSRRQDAMLVILLNCVTLGMFQPCEDVKCKTEWCTVLQRVFEGLGWEGLLGFWWGRGVGSVLWSERMRVFWVLVVWRQGWDSGGLGRDFQYLMHDGKVSCLSVIVFLGEGSTSKNPIHIALQPLSGLHMHGPVIVEAQHYVLLQHDRMLGAPGDRDHLWRGRTPPSHASLGVMAVTVGKMEARNVVPVRFGSGRGAELCDRKCSGHTGLGPN
ncbi:hypothetical protein JZ751_015258 [Albula glossodonta]|uniref:Secreted protein n=1 Tax=Albula glossodonta TaxID=121402 RepID=A0A8T2NUX1_9TELE|nr:hypothetical protein JZ751_015258 [Albula glossodonta]